MIHLKGTETVARRCSVKKVFLEILQNSQENTCFKVSFLIKLQGEASNFNKKETLTQGISFEFYRISKNSFSYKTPPVAASDGRICFKYPFKKHQIEMSRGSLQNESNVMFAEGFLRGLFVLNISLWFIKNIKEVAIRGVL